MIIQLTVSDLGATEAFYGGILDMPVERALTAPGAPEHLVMEWEGARVIFVEEADVMRAHPVLIDRLTTYPKGIGMTLHLAVTGIEEIYLALQEEELDLLYLLEKKPYGTLELWCFDPDGYLVVLEEQAEG